MKNARTFLGMLAVLGVLGFAVVPMAHAQTDANSQTNMPMDRNDRNDNDGPSMGWLGLLGLTGLMGLRRRQTHDDLPAGRAARV